jgi:Effector-associated domain 1
MSADEKWQALAELAADLYQSGPDHDDLWRRAGGRNADLQHQGDGRARWTDALYKMRHGYGLRISELLSQMRKDYPLNDNLRYLSHDPEFQERN